MAPKKSRPVRDVRSCPSAQKRRRSNLTVTSPPAGTCPPAVTSPPAGTSSLPVASPVPLTFTPSLQGSCTLPQATTSATPLAEIDYDKLAEALLMRGPRGHRLAAALDMPEESSGVRSAGEQAGSPLPVMSLIEQLFTQGESSLVDQSLQSCSVFPTDLSAGIPLGSSVSERIKHKIWDEEFLDLRVLGTNFVDDNVSFHVTGGSFNYIMVRPLRRLCPLNNGQPVLTYLLLFIF